MTQAPQTHFARVGWKRSLSKTIMSAARLQTQLHHTSIATAGRVVGGVALLLAAVAIAVAVVVLLLDNRPSCVDPRAVTERVQSPTDLAPALQMRVASSGTAPEAVGLCLAAVAGQGTQASRATVVAKPCSRTDATQQWSFAARSSGNWRMYSLQNGSGVKSGQGAGSWSLVQPCAQRSVDGTCGGPVGDACPLILSNRSTTYQSFAPCQAAAPPSACPSHTGQSVGPGTAQAASPTAMFLLHDRPKGADSSTCGFIMQEAAFSNTTNKLSGQGNTWKVDPTTFQVMWQQPQDGVEPPDTVITFVEVQASPV